MCPLVSPYIDRIYQNINSKTCQIRNRTLLYRETLLESIAEDKDGSGSEYQHHPAPCSSCQMQGKLCHECIIEYSSRCKKHDRIPRNISQAAGLREKRAVMSHHQSKCARSQTDKQGSRKRAVQENCIGGRGR